MHGEDVTLLHDELKTLGFSIPDKEIADGVFGQGTEQAVKEFQQKHGLQMSGIVDQETAAQINREGQGTGLDSAKSFVVKGLVVYANGKPLTDGLVRAFDKDLRSEEFLWETTTDDEGRYAIHYNAEQFSRADLGSADLIVRTYNPDGLKLANSQIVFNARPEETIDLVVGGEVYRGPSEYDQLVKQLTPLLQGLTFAELTEDEEHQDVTFLSGETGENTFHITFLITAHRLAERTDIAPEIFYGLLRNDLPPNLSALLVQDPGLVRRSIEMAAADNKGITKHEFTSIILRVRGIKQGAPLSFWTKRYKHRLEFPEKIIER